MPAAHSKRNTSLAFFTAHERSQLASTWGSQSARLTRDSFLPFGSCVLCLLPATDPVACPGVRKPAPAESKDGGGTKSATKKRKVSEICHVFCRECAMSNLLAQKKELKRLDKASATREAEEAEDDEREAAAAKARAIQDFERVQQGLSSASTGGSGETGRRLNIVGRDSSSGKVTVEEQVADEAVAGTKRSHTMSLTETELLELAHEDDRAKYRKVLEDSKTKTGHSGSFWIPAQTPHSGANASRKQEKQKSQTLCPGSSSAGSEHAMSLKMFIPVKFTTDKHDGVKHNGNVERKTETKAKDTQTFTCPSCNRPLSNAGKAVLAKPCGHVLCAGCVDKFIFSEENEGEVRCSVCGEDLVDHGVSQKSKENRKDKDKDRIRPGLVEISSEGTGFAGGGNSIARQKGTAFQC